MLKDKITLVISSCDKFSDLWDAHIQLLNKNWKDRNIDTILVTDKETSKNYEGVRIISTGEGKEFSERIQEIIPYIKTEFLLITLDDYFLTKKIYTERIQNLVLAMEREDFDYIRVFGIPNSKRKIRGYESLYKIDLNGNYQVNLYPGIWRKSFLELTLEERLNAWEYEVSLTKTARKVDAKCAMSKGKEFEILDVVRKGQLLNRANKYLKKHNLYHGNRSKISYLKELKLDIMFYGKEVLPKWFIKFIKKILVKNGYQFYSDI